MKCNFPSKIPCFPCLRFKSTNFLDSRIVPHFFEGPQYSYRATAMGVRLGNLDQRSHGSQDPEYSLTRACRSVLAVGKELIEGCFSNSKYLNPPGLGVGYVLFLFIILPEILMRDTNEILMRDIFQECDSSLFSINSSNENLFKERGYMFSRKVEGRA